jgi:dipeptidyl aminopeptidase/acylaminoacyl peptidase
VALLLGAVVAADAAVEVPEPRFEIIEHAMVDDVEQAYVRYPSGDLMVTGWLFVHPFGEQDVEPCIVFNHGGVGGVTEGTRAKARWLAKQGFVVFAPSYRGEDDSEGEIEIARGEVDDVVNAVRELRRHPGIRPDRFVLMGTSHGALISVLAAARPEMCGPVRAVVAAYGVMDIYTWYQHLLDHDFDVRDPLSLQVYGDGPGDRPEAFAERHALNVLDDLCPAPILLVQGARDPIVPEPQARVMAQALAGRGRNGDDLRVYEHGGHGFLYWDDPETRTDDQLAATGAAWDDILSFVRRALAEPIGTSP